MKNIKDYERSEPITFAVTPHLLYSRISYKIGLYVDKNCSEYVQRMVRLDNLVKSSFHFVPETFFAVMEERYALNPCTYVDITAKIDFNGVNVVNAIDDRIIIKVTEHFYENMDKNPTQD